jgi:predicted Zn finger-like uncharacterized protein
MDVTCPACNTRYEFDEALVSSRGTTVKCTNCGHQFKVYRPEGASDLDGWTVRTVDGREMRFKAMRELQAAITTGGISREDVLIPGGGGEPRRLGRIEELQSFFALSEEAGPTTRKRHDTPTGHHSVREGGAVPENLMKTAVRGGASQRGSKAPPVDRDRDGEPLPTRTGDTLRPPGSPPSSTHSDGTRAALPPEAPTLPRAAYLPSDIEAAVEAAVAAAPNPARATKMGHGRATNGNGARKVAAPSRHGEKEAVEALTSALRDAALTSAEVSSDSSSGPGSGGRAALEVSGADSGLEEPTNPGRLRSGNEGSASPARPRMPSVEGPTTHDDDTIGDQAEAEAIVSAAIGPKKSAPQNGSAGPAVARVSLGDSVDRDPSLHPPQYMRVSDPPDTPTPSAARPSVLRRSDVYSDPRFSGYSPRGKRPGLARWVVGIVAVGVIGVVGFTYFKRHTPQGPDTTASASADGRVDKLLEEGESKLAEGDLDAAKDSFSRASGVTESDPRVWRALARIEVTRADLLWLELELLGKESPERGGVQQRLGKAAERARAAADRAAQLDADDPLTVSLQMDVLRLEGKKAEARKLSAKVDGAGPDADRARALLDLDEANPNYASILDRLRSAARSERKLGRAQALLVYALARAGKPDVAKKELEALGDLHGSEAVRKALAVFVGAAPAASASASAGKKPPRPAPVDVPVTPRPPSGHYELPDEPDLQPEPSPAPAPDPAPAPAPAPAPVDTSDLPG